MSFENKAILMCLIAFALGCVVACSGCRNTRRAIRVQPPIGAQLDIELQPPIIDLGKP